MRRKRSNTLPPDETSLNDQMQNAIEAFIEYQKSRNRTEKTIKYYYYSINELIRMMDHFEIKKLEDVTVYVIREYIAYRLDSGIKDKTVNQYLRGWKPFFRFICDEDIIKSSNPMLKISELKEDERIVETFSKSQIVKLFESIDKNTFTGYRDYLIMALMLDTGCRVGELVGIKISDINFTEGTIKVFGKARKDRLLPFQETLAGIFDKYISIRGKLQHDFLFVNIENEPLRTRTIQDRIHDYGRRARIRDVRVSPHTFRHTFAKMYVLNGGDTLSLQKILGHSSLEMVQRYVNLFGKELINQHRKYSPLEKLYEDE